MLRYVKSGMMLMSIAYIVLGLMLLIMPETSLLWICYAFGVVVLITGIVCLIQYARIRGHRLHRALYAGGRCHHGRAGPVHFSKTPGGGQLSAGGVWHLYRGGWLQPHRLGY